MHDDKADAKSLQTQNYELVKKLEKANRENQMLKQIIEKSEAQSKNGSSTGSKHLTKSAEKRSQHQALQTTAQRSLKKLSCSMRHWEGGSHGQK